MGCGLLSISCVGSLSCTPVFTEVATQLQSLLLSSQIMDEQRSLHEGKCLNTVPALSSLNCLMSEAFSVPDASSPSEVDDVA